ncbi:helix-turn-helix domain-containing protein [Hydrogenophaga crocea]|uniref:Helix-turn-helix domain-containing protein n=1 Tax=Hydrogenophaga crocea TaxID=2716225 RepID=A0A6G8IC85_9BURK|nr:helix-turn-helix domain-containing protein [Hydrogenophaga crocea]QIM50762.1 helix-turn-helix domain-containing protein [Hydrogenophaga crocea]
MRSTQNPDLMQAFAAEVKARRGELGISQEELAHRAAVNRTFVAKVELAQNQPSLTVLHKLSLGLEMDLPELLRLTLLRYKRLKRTKT